MPVIWVKAVTKKKNAALDMLSVHTTAAGAPSQKSSSASWPAGSENHRCLDRMDFQ